MKVALVTYSDIFDKTDGLTKYYRRLYHYARRDSGLQIDFFMQGCNRKRTNVKDGARVHYVTPRNTIELLPKSLLSTNPLFYLKAISFFYKRFKRERYHVVQITSPHPLCACALIVAKRLDIPVIGSYHTRIPEYAGWWAKGRFSSRNGKHISNQLVRIVTLWTKLIYRSCKLVLAPTHGLARELIREGYAKSTAVVGRGVESGKFKPIQKGNDNCRLLYVGRLSPEKNLGALKFLGKYPSLELTLVGDGNLNDIKKALPFARFMGYLSGARLHEEFGKADVFVFPSKTETFGNSVIEALSSGLPVIAFRNAGLEDRVLPEVNGYLASTPREFEEATLLLARSPEIRKRMAVEARNLALRFRWPEIMKQQVALFYKVRTEYDGERRLFLPILKRVIYSFNISHAVLGALKMCVYVFLANMSAGLVEGLYAGTRQAFLSFFMIGINTSFYEVLSYRNRLASIALPSILTSTVALIVHWLSGTPNLFATWLLVLLLALFNFSVLSFLHVRHKTISPWELIRIYSSAAFQLFKYVAHV